MQDLANMNKIMKEYYLPGDARSRRGTMARGRNVYMGSRMSPKPKRLGRKKRIVNAASRRLGM